MDFDSAYIKQHWGSILDIVLGGELVAVRRHDRPVAIIVNPDKWNALQAELATLRERVREGIYYTPPDVLDAVSGFPNAIISNPPFSRGTEEPPKE